MTPGLLKMWVSFAGMILLLVAALLIMLSRQKLRGILKVLTAIIAYIFMTVGSLIIILTVISGSSD